MWGEFLENINNLSTLSENDISLIFTLLFLTAVIVIYSLFVFYFYRFLAKKNIINLNLHQYNKSENETVTKFLAIGFYILEYIIILPIVTFFWFAFLAVFILMLTKNLSVSSVLLIAAAFVASVRVTSYISETLSQDLAKMLPFTLLAFAITGESFFKLSGFSQQISEIPSLLASIPQYLLFIVIVELIMRFADLMSRIFMPLSSEDEEPEKD